MENTFIVIPTYDPDESIMIQFINELKKEFTNILIINDGSNIKHKEFFENFKKENIEVINNYKNMGKGRAMKNAFNYLLNKYPNIIGCVTCDCDGQHTVSDVKKLNEYLKKQTNELILGVRDFNQSNVPFKSRYGNKITRSILKNIIGLNITDTQTGLRAFSKNLMYEFLDVSGERYEYETNMLVECQKRNIKIKEIIIETVYINDNKTSHFNPIKDSIKIYKTFANNFIKIIINYLINILLFYSIYKTSNNIILSSIIAGIITTINYTIINKKILFNNQKLSFYILFYIISLIKIILVGILLNLIFNNKFILIGKILFDSLLSLIMYLIKYNIPTK